MTRRLTVLLAALEAVLAVAIGVAIPLVPLTIVWAAQFGFGPDWLIFWRGAVVIWLLGHGVDVTFTLPAEIAGTLDVTGAGQPVVVTLALLGFALLTALLGVRAGGRIADSGHARLGALSALGAFAVLSAGLTLTVLHPLARPSIWQAALLPALAFGIGVGLGMLRAARDRQPGQRGRLLRRWGAVSIDTRATAVAALRAGVGAVALVLTVSALAVAARLVFGYAEIIRLYEALHTEVVGGIAVTALQLALLPDLVVWAAAWFTGPGFAIGTGSQVSPLGTALGPLPALPLFGALPTADLPLGFAGLLVPVVAGFLAGVAVRPALLRAVGEIGDDVRGGIRAGTVVLVGLAGGVIGALILSLLAWSAAGSAGPGRFADLGPSPVAVGFAALLELAPAIAAGLASGGALRRRG